MVFTHLETVECYRRDADGRHEHVRAGEHRHELAHEVAEVPHGHGHLHEVEGLREEAQRQIGDGQIDDEDVARSAHVRVLRDDVTHESVSGCAEDDKYRERDDEHNLGARREVAHRNHALIVLLQESLDLLSTHESIVERERTDVIEREVAARPSGGVHGTVSMQRHLVDVPRGDARRSCPRLHPRPVEDRYEVDAQPKSQSVWTAGRQRVSDSVVCE